MPLRKTLPFFLLLLVLIPLAALENSNSVHLELLGKSSITADISYERSITDRFALGAGFGINNITRVDFVYEDTVYQAVDISMPLNLYGIFTITGNRHRLIAPFGCILFTEFSLHRYSTYFTATPAPFIGLGYELKGDRFTFRFPVYLTYLGPDTEILMEFMPWAGLSFGYSF